MLITIIGENCTGKSTLAENINERFEFEIISGKDYLRFAKNQDEAKSIFVSHLESAVKENENIIYVISEKEQLDLLPIGAKRILVKAKLETIKERFAKRMNGNLPEPVSAMLERKHGMFDDIECDYEVFENEVDIQALLDFISKNKNVGKLI